jgi:hypothetical protein
MEIFDISYHIAYNILLTILLFTVVLYFVYYLSVFFVGRNDRITDNI